MRERLAGWETGLIETARHQGASWADLAHPLGVASRQAAALRYLTDDEREQHAAALRGLLYFACPDAPATAISETAKAIAQRAEGTPTDQSHKQHASTSPKTHPLSIRWT